MNAPQQPTTVFESHQGALLQTDANMLLILRFLQFLNYQRNNKTLMYRLLDVANQVDWVSVLREATPPSKPPPPTGRAEAGLFSVLPAPERARGANGDGDLERARPDPGGEEPRRHPQQLPGVANQRSAAPLSP